MTSKDLGFRSMTSLYITRRDQILFLYRTGSSATHDSYIATAGGHFEPEELNNPKACVLRELNEETGLTENDIGDMKLRYIALRNFKDEIRQIYYYFAEIKDHTVEIKSNEGTLEWVTLPNALSLDMPLTAKEVIHHYIETGRKDSYVYGGMVSKHNTKFTLLSES